MINCCIFSMSFKFDINKIKINITLILTINIIKMDDYSGTFGLTNIGETLNT